MVGLYGDPDTTWGIAVELCFDEPMPLAGVHERLALLFARHQHLGPTPVIQRVSAADWHGQLQTTAAREFGGDGFLVRVLVSEDHRMLFVAAHHGVCDGLGLLAVAEEVCQAGLRPLARGIGQRTSRRAFTASSVVRVLEALVRPPARFLGSAADGEGQENLDRGTGEVIRADSASMSYVVTRAFAAWRATSGGARPRLLVVVGASRRQPETLAPDRQTAYLRFPLKREWGLAEVRRQFSLIEPEPDFPETSALGIGPLVTHLLRGRLGATATISNLGIILGDHLVSVSMFPALNGPQAVAIGLASTSRTTTVSLRTRASDFTAEESSRLRAMLETELRSAQQGGGKPSRLA